MRVGSLTIKDLLILTGITIIGYYGYKYGYKTYKYLESPERIPEEMQETVEEFIHRKEVEPGYCDYLRAFYWPLGWVLPEECVGPRTTR